MEPLTEPELKTDEAWAAMIRPRTILTIVAGIEPMPPDIALDFVQDVIGERDDAVTALLYAAGRWLEKLMPTGPDLCNVLADAWAVVGDLRDEFFGHAESWTGTIRFRCEDLRQTRLAYPGTIGPAAFDQALDWQQWTRAADAALKLARAVCAAAYPEEAR